MGSFGGLSDAKNALDAYNQLSNAVGDNNVTSFQCWRNLDTVLCTGYAALAALPITIGISFTMRREKRCLDYCDGRPGVAFPWDTLVYTKRRLQTVLSMLMICFPAYLIVQKHSLIFTWAPADASWVKTPIKIAAILLSGLSLHPLFLSTIKPCILTHTVALLMAIYHTIIVLLPIIMCVDDESPGELAIDILYALPSIIAGLCLSVMLLYRLIKSIMKIRNAGKKWKQQLLPDEKPHECKKVLQSKENYVRQLFRQTYRLQRAEKVRLAADAGLKLDEHEHEHEHKKTCCKSKDKSKSESKSKTPKIKQTWRKDAFYYPVTMLCSLAASFALIYYMLIFTVTLLLKIRVLIGPELLTVNGLVNDSRTIEEVFANVTKDGKIIIWDIVGSIENLFTILGYVCRCLIAIVITSIVLTTVNGIVVLVLIFFNYRSNVLRAYAGNYVDLLPRARANPASAVKGLCRYGGYQVGYIAWSMLLQFVMYSLVMVFVWYIILMPLVFNYDIFFKKLILKIWPSLLIAFCMAMLQTHIPRFVFVVDRGRKLAVRRRTIFMIWSYYSFIISTVMGLISCLLRLVKAFVIAFVFLARLDWCSLPPRFRFLDGGHSAYMGQLHSDVSHTHPVMITFIEILKRGAEQTRRKRQELMSSKSCCAEVVYLENSNVYEVMDTISCDSTAKLKQDDSTQSIATLDILSHELKSNEAKKWKWLVAYTLINNPLLLQDRKNLASKRELKQFDTETKF